MLAIEFIQWWYGRGYKSLFFGIGVRIRRIILLFSLPLLIRTLTAPWRRIVSDGGSSLGDRFRALIDNLISRTVGFCVRVVVILAAALAVVLLAAGGLVLLVIWPFLPMAALALIIRGFFPW